MTERLQDVKAERDRYRAYIEALECPNPDCDDGVLFHNGKPCYFCSERTKCLNGEYDWERKLREWVEEKPSRRSVETYLLEGNRIIELIEDDNHVRKEFTRDEVPHHVEWLIRELAHFIRQR